MNPGGSLAAPNTLRGLTSRLVFLNTDACAQHRVVGSDGTAAGTGLVRDIYPGPTCHSLSSRGCWLGNQALFVANDGITGELWVTDGTFGWYDDAKDIDPGIGNSNPQTLRVIGNRCFSPH